MGKKHRTTEKQSRNGNIKKQLKKKKKIIWEKNTEQQKTKVKIEM